MKDQDGHSSLICGSVIVLLDSFCADLFGNLLKSLATFLVFWLSDANSSENFLGSLTIFGKLRGVSTFNKNSGTKVFKVRQTIGYALYDVTLLMVLSTGPLVRNTVKKK